jgi:hypothetical protein
MGYQLDDQIAPAYSPSLALNPSHHSFSGGKKFQVSITLIFLIAFVCLGSPAASREPIGGVARVQIQQSGKAGAITHDAFETKPAVRKSIGMGSIDLRDPNSEWVHRDMSFRFIVWTERGDLPCASEVISGFHGRAPPASI